MSRVCGCAFAQEIDELPHRVDVGETRLFDDGAELLFERHHELDSLHGIKAEIEFEIRVRPDRAPFGRRHVADHSERFLYLRFT